MEWQEIRTALARLAPPFPRAAANDARVRWAEFAPLFIAEIERVADGGTPLLGEIDGEFDGLFSFATYLAAEHRDTRAYRPLARAAQCSEDRAHELFGDDVGTQLGRMLASVCDGDLAPLKALAEDRAAGMWCRYAALSAMAVRVVEGEGDRDQVLDYIGTLCEREVELLRHAESEEDQELGEFLTWAVDVTHDIGPAPLMDKIRAWFGEGLIDPMVTGLKWFEKNTARSAADCIAEAAGDKANRYIRDALDEMASWYCYQPRKPRPARKLETSAWPLHDAPEGKPVARDLPKVGRNDPCPCGSGKKFKKCCARETAEPTTEDSKNGAISRALAWLSSRHAKAFKTALTAAINDELGNEEQDRLAEVDDEDWEGIQINAVEWLLAEGSIAVKGSPRRVADLLLAPGGPAFAPEQRRWIEQLSRRPLRAYDITDVLPGVGMTLCDALDTEAPPIRVLERSGSTQTRPGTLIGARIMEVAGHHELSDAAYPFSPLMNAALLAALREAEEDAGDSRTRALSTIIRRFWIAQYAQPLPLPTVIDSHTGDPILLITDHYRVADWDTLAKALESQPDVEGERASGWSRLIECDDGLKRPLASINPGKRDDRIEVFYKTQNLADQGRSWFEALAGESVEFAGRVLSDPKGIMNQAAAGASKPAAPDLPPDVMADLVEKALYRSYAHWADEPIPALGHKTPRQAITTPAGVERVKGLLRSYEDGEREQARQQGRRQISYDFLWQAIGLERTAG